MSNKRYFNKCANVNVRTVGGNDCVGVNEPDAGTNHCKVKNKVLNAENNTNVLKHNVPRAIDSNNVHVNKKICH